MHIDARDVHKSYGSVTALDGLSLSIPGGSTFGLLGTNGAGKTTLFRLLIGHERPDAGTVHIGETDVATAGARIRERVGYLPERAGFPPELTGREVLRTHARVRGTPGATDRIDDVLATVGLADDADRAVDGYSNGMRRRLGLATALLPDPDVLLLDEPTAGLDPLGVATFREVVGNVRERTDATVVISSHAIPLMEQVCDRVAIIDDGRLRATDEVQALTGNGSTRTVVVRTGLDPSEELIQYCEAHGDVSVRPDHIAVTVPTEEVLDALAAIADRVGADTVGLRDGGLEAVFESVVAGERQADESRSEPPDSVDAHGPSATAPQEGSS